MKKTNKSAVSNKKAFQTALMQKAANKAASCPTKSENSVANEATTSEVATSNNNAESFQKALDLLLSNYPADGRNKRTDFSAVLSILLKLNVDTMSAKEISSETEKALNILGFTVNKAEDKENICKDEIPALVTHLFEGYQAKHPQFCTIGADILHNCPTELEAISKKVWHPIVRYIACQTASSMTEEDAKHLLSGNDSEIADVLKNVKCAEQTRSVLASIAPELGKLIKTLNTSAPHQNVIPSGNCPFAALNPNDFPSYEEKPKTTGTTDAEAIFPEDRISSAEYVVEEEKVEKEISHEVETPSAPSSSATDITSKQNNSITALAHTVKVLKAYGDLLRSLEAEGFTVKDAKAIVEAEALGFSFNELLHNEKMVETLSSIVNTLK